MNYGKAVRTIRAARGMSQKELAERVGLNPSYLSLIESGKRIPATNVLEDLAKALRVPLYLLLLLGSTKEDLHGISEAQARTLGKELLGIVLQEPIEQG